MVLSWTKDIKYRLPSFTVTESTVCGYNLSVFQMTLNITDPMSETYELDQRAQLLLKQLINQYTLDAQPVGRVNPL